MFVTIHKYYMEYFHKHYLYILHNYSGGNYYSHLTDDKIEAQRIRDICL